jgi:mRNA-degrading endonuclease RelE of RelBE toxin-antitoxin system
MEKSNFRSLFEKALLEKFGASANFELLEQKVSHLRTGVPIKYEDLETIADESLWPFKKFWKWPAKEQIKEGLNKTGALLIKISEYFSKNEKEVISSLNIIFNNIALVSILLRFIFPEYYGIYSPPVLHIVGVERGKNEVEDYLNYLQILRITLGIYEIRERYDVERVADVDMVLFAVAELGGEDLDEFNNLYWKSYTPEETYLIELGSEFRKSIDAHDKGMKARILEAIINLCKKPMISVGDTIKPLTNYKYDFWRYRLGDYRLIYLTNEQKKIVRLFEFGKREDIYKKLDRKYKR